MEEGIAHPFRPGEAGSVVPHDLTPEQPSHPALHWGTFTMKEDLNGVLSLARGEVAGAGFQILKEPNLHEPAVVGQVPTAIVLVACAALGDRQTWVMVAATSTDSATAERFRNLIREQIFKSVPVD